MKRYVLAVVTVALSIFSLGGCANQQTATAAADNADPARKTYNQHDLERSGRVPTDQALQQIDPNIQPQRHP